MTRLLVLAIAACGVDGGDTGDLPCDVAAVLEAHCWTCHGNPPAGAPMSLASDRDLVAMSPLGGSFAHRAYVRMTDPMSPMPPGAGVTVPAADLASFKAWLDAGTPSEACYARRP
jgi:hypothetical protein